MNYDLNLASNGIKGGCFFSNRQLVSAVASALSSITFKEKRNSGLELSVPMKQH